MTTKEVEKEYNIAMNMRRIIKQANADNGPGVSFDHTCAHLEVIIERLYIDNLRLRTELNKIARAANQAAE